MMLHRLLTATLTIAVCGGLTAAAEGANRTLRLGSDGRLAAIGSFKFKQDPRLGKALAAFGTPDVRAGGGEICRLRWNHLGLYIMFSNFGGTNSCDANGGYAQRLTIKGKGSRGWHTQAGLYIGSRENRITRLHPMATKHSNGWWLTTVPSLFGDNRPEPGLRAKVYRGRVSSFRAFLGGAGD
jgi:hypothetical protein